MQFRGSSPHARGKPNLACLVLLDVGLIPACAGKTTRPRPAAGQSGAHPRMRGENHPPQTGGRTEWGSSPHARGKPHQCLPGGQSQRLIPACAGKTEPDTPVYVGVEAHPRMRGENRRGGKAHYAENGSSPHARGKPGSRFPAISCQGLIPACAGKTTTGLSLQPPAWAHPRMRGENCDFAGLSGLESGSSPHARGKRNRQHTVSTARRLIPACAGKTAHDSESTG